MNYRYLNLARLGNAFCIIYLTVLLRRATMKHKNTNFSLCKLFFFEITEKSSKNVSTRPARLTSEFYFAVTSDEKSTKKSYAPHCFASNAKFWILPRSKLDSKRTKRFSISLSLSPQKDHNTWTELVQFQLQSGNFTLSTPKCKSHIRNNFAECY